ncbi:hypothetical protein RJ639_039638 [Escallonia herrerae]|uniref:Bet1-like protein n=1 Tax=Escallonia herrerae TaxID=1293975 RepID=A0AA88WLT4_9ASTE|nr:hypothetical protein RJ639_039638 [Escallonia herrerae]
MASSSHRGGDYYGAAPYRSREGLSTRAGGGSDEIQLRIDPMHGELDDEITGLRKQVRQLRNVAQDIESEAKFQNDFINQLHHFLLTANDTDQSTSRSEEQHEEIEQEHHPAGIKPCHACCSFCTRPIFSGLLLVQILAKMRTIDLLHSCQT